MDRISQHGASYAKTRGIQIWVKSEYLPEHSNEARAQYAFAYTIRIRNDGRKPTQLHSRHWIITDANGKVQEVRGEGVIGEQPIIAPGEEFEYSSWCVLATPQGKQQGSYLMLEQGGESFEATVATFSLFVPQMMN